jgi:ATP-dependent Lhr-like helicase
VFDLLSAPIRKYIRDKRWEFLRPIQAAAIQKILTSPEHVILASRTASGKTEAAFLPILSKVDFGTAGVKVLYISPLIALINDQFSRVEDLCAYLDVKVTKWHGEANRTLKEKLVKDPSGVVLITPESIEAMLANAPYKAKALFNDLQYVVIDEIHSFIGSDRGIQLKSLLSRLQSINQDKFLIVGLSATIGDYDEAKKMSGDAENTKVLLDKTSKESKAEIKYFEGTPPDLPLDLLKDLYLKTKDSKVLVFPNSRGRAEEVAVKLQKISDKVKGHSYYFSHHSSVDKELREYIEHFAKNNVRYPFTIACTSTLELGIDIGSVEKVVQIDATHSIASLIQRVGRSGRRDGEISQLLFYATDKWHLLQTLACLSLYKESFIEPVYATKRPYDILLHQLLSYTKQLSGIKPAALTEIALHNYAFTEIEKSEVTAIIDHLVHTEMLELIGGELIIGIEAERLVNSKDFYSVFITEPSYKVLHQDKNIGEIPWSLQLLADENILLAARIWKIVDIDHQSKKITVIPAKDGKKPVFSGSGADVHYKIRERMLQVLYESTLTDDLDEASRQIMLEIRKDFCNYQIGGLEDDRPVLIKENELQWFTFQSTKVNKSLRYLFGLLGITDGYNEHDSSFSLKGDLNFLKNQLIQAAKQMDDIDFHLENSLRVTPSIIEFSKWGIYLPINFQVILLKEKFFDFTSTHTFLENLRLITATGH